MFRLDGPLRVKAGRVKAGRVAASLAAVLAAVGVAQAPRTAATPANAPRTQEENIAILRKNGANEARRAATPGKEGTCFGQQEEDLSQAGRVKRSVVLLLIMSSEHAGQALASGTGFVVAGSGEDGGPNRIMTARHVWNAASREGRFMAVMSSDGRLMGGAGAARVAVTWASSMQGVTERAFLRSGRRLGVPCAAGPAGVARHWERMGLECAPRGGVDVAYHVDRPLVDYIRVYREGDDIRPLPGLRFRNGQPPFQDGRAAEDYRGLGLMLYVEGARWLGEHGMLLHASSLQEPETRRAWASLERRFPAAVLQTGAHGSTWDAGDSRKVMDGSSLPDAWYPPGTASFAVVQAPPGRPARTNNLGDLEPSIRHRFEERDAAALLGGRDPMGAEATPCSPLAAIQAGGTGWVTHRPGRTPADGAARLQRSRLSPQSPANW